MIFSFLGYNKFCFETVHKNYKHQPIRISLLKINKKFKQNYHLKFILIKKNEKHIVTWMNWHRRDCLVAEGEMLDFLLKNKIVGCCSHSNIWLKSKNKTQFLRFILRMRHKT